MTCSVQQGGEKARKYAHEQQSAVDLSSIGDAEGNFKRLRDVWDAILSAGFVETSANLNPEARRVTKAAHTELEE